MAGCDYIENSLNGVGITKAAKFFTMTDAVDLGKVGLVVVMM